MLSAEEIKHLSKLSKLELSAEEATSFEHQLSSILDFIAVINEVDTSNVEPLEHVASLNTVLRPDVVVNPINPTYQRGDVAKAIIAGFPDKTDDLLRVPAVFS